jgi:phosphoribosylglycinamide formyltransferase-1
LKIGVVASSGGSAFGQIARIVRTTPGVPCEFCAISDRPCGFEQVCHDEGVECARIEERSRARFSQAVAEHLSDVGNVDACLLFLDRLVGPELFARCPTFNIHPSLLPAFPGREGVAQASRRGVRFLGATLHLVDAGIDTGPIIAQTITPLAGGESPSQLEKFAYIQKVYLGLLLVDALRCRALRVSDDLSHAEIHDWHCVSDRASPALRNPGFLAGIQALERREQTRVFCSTECPRCAS